MVWPLLEIREAIHVKKSDPAAFPGGRRSAECAFRERPAGACGESSLVGGAATAEPAKTYPVGDQIGLALIGAGGRGQDDTQTALQVPGVKLVAAADCYDGRLTHCKERWGSGVFTTRDYREILARSDVDAVLIATPDHWHKQAAMDAMQAGKDVYLEKPMIHLYSDGPEIIATARRTGRILQVGSQRVSSIVYKQAKQLLESGAIGKVNVVNAWWDRSPNNPVLAFNSTIPPDASPETIDWQRFVGSAPPEPFNAEHFFQWRKWKDYGSGVAGDLFVHLFSGTHFITGLPRPHPRPSPWAGFAIGTMAATNPMCCWGSSITPRDSTFICG